MPSSYYEVDGLLSERIVLGIIYIVRTSTDCPLVVALKIYLKQLMLIWTTTDKFL